MKRNNRGFTLMEMLIVVAIIAVLVAIAIPIFANQLEKSREAVDLANLRAAYAEVMAAVITDKGSDGSSAATGDPTKNVLWSNKDGEQRWYKAVPVTQRRKGWQGAEPNIGGVTDVPELTKGQKWQVTYSAKTGLVTITKAAGATG